MKNCNQFTFQLHLVAILENNCFNTCEKFIGLRNLVSILFMITMTPKNTTFQVKIQTN